MEVKSSADQCDALPTPKDGLFPSKVTVSCLASRERGDWLDADRPRTVEADADLPHRAENCWNSVSIKKGPPLLFFEGMTVRFKGMRVGEIVGGSAGRSDHGRNGPGACSMLFRQDKDTRIKRTKSVTRSVSWRGGGAHRQA